MPTLRKTKDGHFVVKTHLIRFQTLQITDVGIAYLHQRGVEVDQNFPQWMWRELVFFGQLYTYGTGEHTDYEAKEHAQQLVRSDPFPGSLNWSRLL